MLNGVTQVSHAGAEFELLSQVVSPGLSSDGAASTCGSKGGSGRLGKKRATSDPTYESQIQALNGLASGLYKSVSAALVVLLESHEKGL